MAGRKDKNVVDYFPHYVNGGKTLFILENKYKSDGYTAWFKLLEILGNSDNHYIDCRNETDWEFLCAKIPLMQTELKQIIDLLAKLGAIHQELWQNKIIWSGNFIKNISDVYKRRKQKCMNFYDLCEHLSVKCKHKYDLNGNIVNKNSQSKVKKSIVKYTKEKINKKEKYKNFIKKFNKVTGKKIRVPDNKFKRQYNARIKEGFTEKEILKASYNCSQDSYHKEYNLKYLTPEFITRADKLQKYLTLTPKTIIKNGKEYKKRNG